MNAQIERALPVTIGVNGFTLKLIALITMMTDHVGAVLFSYGVTYTWLRAIGRLAFPIYCFLLVEGFHHTRNVMKYILRLGIFAVISEVPFDLCFEGVVWDPGHQNVFISLLMGVTLLLILERIREIPVKLLLVVSFCVIAQEIHCDYRYIGILMILFYEVFREIPLMKNFSQLLCNIKFSSMLQNVGIFALIPIALYNGKKGPSMKYFFYAIYPVHLLIIYFVARHRGIY